MSSSRTTSLRTSSCPDTRAAPARTNRRKERRLIRERAGIRRRALRVVPEHVVPLVLFLAEQDALGVTGQVINALQWNEEHGLSELLNRGCHGERRNVHDHRD